MNAMCFVCYRKGTLEATCVQHRTSLAETHKDDCCECKVSGLFLSHTSLAVNHTKTKTKIKSEQTAVANLRFLSTPSLSVGVVVMVVLAFSSLVRIQGECSTVHFPPAHFFSFLF